MFDNDASHLSNYTQLDLGGTYGKTVWYIHPPIDHRENATWLLGIDYHSIDPNPDWHISSDLHLKLYQLEVMSAALFQLAKDLRSLLEGKPLQMTLADYPVYEFCLSGKPDSAGNGYEVLYQYNSHNNGQQLSFAVNVSAQIIRQFSEKLTSVMNTAL